MQLHPGRYRTITIGALLALCAIVVTGAAVRLTGSGLGCDDWPNCNDTKFVDVSSGHAAIEQVNRLFTGVVALAVIAAVLGSLVRVPRRRDLTRLSVGLVAGVIGQVVLGGITVLVDLHPLAVQGHFLLSMVLVANATVLVRRAGEPDGATRRPAMDPRSTRLAWLLAAATTVAIVTGTVVTNTGPHAGDEDARRFGFDISHVARIHGISVMAAIAVALVLSRWQRQRVTTWLFVAVLQAVVGYVQYFNDVPALLVGVHVAGATALYVATVQLVLDTRVAERDPARAVFDEGARVGM